jgi:hypothetical protein
MDAVRVQHPNSRKIAATIARLLRTRKNDRPGKPVKNIVIPIGGLKNESVNFETHRFEGRMTNSMLAA